MKKNKAFIAFLKKLKEMPKEEFDQMLKKHAEGDIAQILMKSGMDLRPVKKRIKKVKGNPT